MGSSASLDGPDLVGTDRPSRGCISGSGSWSAATTPGSWMDEVYLNGDRLDLCIKCNAAQGWALIYVEDEKGNIVRELGIAQTTLVYGNVEVRRVN